MTFLTGNWQSFAHIHTRVRAFIRHPTLTYAHSTQTPLPFRHLPPHTHLTIHIPPPPPTARLSKIPPNDAIRADAPTKSAYFMLQAEGVYPQATRVRDLAPPKPTTTPHLRTQPLPVLPPTPPQPSRFAHPNPFQPLSNDTFPPDPSHPSDFVRPFCLDSDCLDLPLSPLKSPPLSRSVS